MDVQLPPLQAIDLAVSTPVSVYLKSLLRICPFIEPSAGTRCLWGCVVALDCQTAEEIHARLFEQLVPLIERFRDMRRMLTEKQQRLLICHTVVVHVPPHLDAATVRLMNWPNWLGWALKQFYTPKEIVFGFVRKNVVEQSQTGEFIPGAPFHAIVIRSRVVGLDQRFFPGNQTWLEAMMQADDDGENVHSAVFGDAPNIRDPQALRDARYFERVAEWGKKILPGQ